MLESSPQKHLTIIGTSKEFNDYCLALGINIEHSVSHVHTQNELAESLIKE